MKLVGWSQEDRLQSRVSPALGPPLPPKAAMPSLTLLIACLSSVVASFEEPPHFARDILPILSENCFACHGPDVSDRKSDLRLDTRESLLECVDLVSPRKSELIQRILSTDEDLRMPPTSSHKKPLSQRQVESLVRWIELGAPWGTHWSFQKPVKVSLPELPGLDNPIDRWIRSKLLEKGIQPAGPAAPGNFEDVSPSI